MYISMHSHFIIIAYKGEEGMQQAGADLGLQIGGFGIDMLRVSARVFLGARRN